MKVLKELTEELAPISTALFNLSLEIGAILQDWSDALITIIMIVPVETKMGMVYTLHLRVIYSHHRALFTKSGNLFADGSQLQLEP